MNAFLEIEFRKKIRRRVINIYLYFISFINLPPNILGLLIKIAHFNTPVSIFALLTVCPQIMAYLLTVIIWWVVLIFFYLNGCFLSVVEYRLDNQDITMMDPVIYLCGDKITKKTRNSYSFYIGLYYVFILMCIVKIRFDPPYYVYLFIFLSACVLLIVDVAILSTVSFEFFDTDVVHPMIKIVNYYKSTESKTLIKKHKIY